MIIIPKRLDYYPSEYVLSQGCKKGTHAHKTYCGFLRPRSNGWAEEFVRSELYLNAELPDGSFCMLQVDQQLRPLIGRITRKRVAKLEKSMPDTLTIVPSKNEQKFLIFEADLVDWLEASGI